jgi:hypothetical protein
VPEVLEHIVEIVAVDGFKLLHAVYNMLLSLGQLMRLVVLLYFEFIIDEQIFGKCLYHSLGMTI